MSTAFRGQPSLISGSRRIGVISDAETRHAFSLFSNTRFITNAFMDCAFPMACCFDLTVRCSGGFEEGPENVREAIRLYGFGSVVAHAPCACPLLGFGTVMACNINETGARRRLTHPRESGGPIGLRENLVVDYNHPELGPVGRLRCGGQAAKRFEVPSSRHSPARGQHQSVVVRGYQDVWREFHRRALCVGPPTQPPSSPLVTNPCPSGVRPEWGLCVREFLSALACAVPAHHDGRSRRCPRCGFPAEG